MATRVALFQGKVLDAQSALDTTGAIPIVGRGAKGVAYVTWGAAVSAGRVVLEEAPFQSYPGTWHQVHEFLFTQADTTDAYHFEGTYGALRLRIATAVTGDTVDGEAILS